MLCGKLLWEENIFFDIENDIDLKSHLYPIIENLAVVREELINLENDSNLKTNELEQERLQTEKIVESLTSSILIVDHMNDIIIEANPAACKLLESTKEELLNSKFSIYVANYESDNSIENAEELLKKENSEMGKHEDLLYTKSGTIIPVLRSSVKIRMKNKNYTLENFVDMSQVKKQEEELKKSLSITKKLNKFTFNRENRIIEMKKEVNELLLELKREEKYKSVLSLC